MAALGFAFPMARAPEPLTSFAASPCRVSRLASRPDRRRKNPRNQGFFFKVLTPSRVGVCHGFPKGKLHPWAGRAVTLAFAAGESLRPSHVC